MAKWDEREIAAMREAVTSPGGTTEAALKVFQKGDQLAVLMEKAVLAAAKKASELAS